LIAAPPEPEILPPSEIEMNAYEPLVPWMRPCATSIAIGITPQWPLVVTAVSVQAPSYRDALTAGKLQSESMVAVAPLTTKRRLPIIE
jgi:hypothetical protein